MNIDSGSSVRKQNLAVRAPYGWKWLIPEAKRRMFLWDIFKKAMQKVEN